jgi:hypothetical protein
MRILDINIRAWKITYEKIKRIKVWYKATIKPKTNYLELLDFIVDQFIIYKRLDYINTNDVKEQLDSCKPVLKYYRIDTNFDPSIQEIVEACKEYFESKNEKKTTNEITKYCYTLLLDLHPEIVEILDKNKLIKQKSEIEKVKLQKQQEVEKIKMRI